MQRSFQLPVVLLFQEFMQVQYRVQGPCYFSGLLYSRCSTIPCRWSTTSRCCMALFQRLSSCQISIEQFLWPRPSLCFKGTLPSFYTAHILYSHFLSGWTGNKTTCMFLACDEILGLYQIRGWSAQHAATTACLQQQMDSMLKHRRETWSNIQGNLVLQVTNVEHDILTVHEM